MTHTINLEDTPSSMDIFRFASAQAGKGFSDKPSEKLPTPCELFRSNKLKSFKLKTLKNGNVRLSFVSSDGREHYAIHRNFLLTYVKLVRSYVQYKTYFNHGN